MSEVSLSSVLEQVVMERDLAEITEKQYRKSIASYSEYLGRDALVKDLDCDSVNAWLKSMKGLLDPRTVLGRKKGITVVWNALADSGKIEHYNPRRLFRPKLEERPVVAWTLEDVAILLDASLQLKGDAFGIPHCKMVYAWILVGYDSAFRPSDMRRIVWGNVDLRLGAITLTQSKTKRVHRACLSDLS